MEPVPSVRVIKGALVAPSVAASYYGSGTIRTDGLCRDYSSNLAICPSGQRPLSPEIVELSRALGGQRTGSAAVTDHINLVYEYVRNRIDTEFMFGAHKGSVGVIMDGSGTAFDQAALMVDLLKASNVSSVLKYGTVTLTQQQFADWTGISQARAACQFLAQGGIPGSVANGCSSTGGTGTVVMNHVWVQVSTPAGAFLFDPSYKPYTHRAGLDLAAASGLAAGEAAAVARNGQSPSTTTVGQLNASGLGARLQTASVQLFNRLKQVDMQGADMTEVVGGRAIQPYVRSGAALQQSSLPYSASLISTWNAVPDQFRAVLSVALVHHSATQYDVDFFSDEIYGRKLQIIPEQVAATEIAAAYAYRPRLVWDGVPLVQGVGINDTDQVAFDLTLSANHPFAAPADGGAIPGALGDSVVLKRAKALQPIALVHAWGLTSSQIGAAWDREQGVDTVAPEMWVSNSIDSPPPLQSPSSSGDLLRARIGAGWLAQFSRAAELHGEIADSRVVLLHTLGIVAADMNLARPVSPPYGYPADEGVAIADETTIIDLETTFGLTSRSSDVIDRRAAVHSIAVTAAALEGSIIEQLMDTPDTASTARRLAWGNAPQSGETPSTANRAVRRFTAGSAADPAPHLVVEGLASGVHGTWNGQPSLTFRNSFLNRLSETISAYAAEGYDVTASTEALLGPGHRLGSEYLYNVTYNPDPQGPGGSQTNQFRRAPSLQSGGALIANRYDASGDPDRIAHVLTGYSGLMKGGGGASTSRENNFDPRSAADALKDRFVDRSSALGVNLTSGAVGYSTPRLKSVGQGGAPHKLEYAVAARGGQLNTPAVEPPLGDPRDKDGLVTNWHGSADIGSSGLEAMGQARPEAATATIVAFLAMQDIWREAPGADREVIGALTADWWGRRILMNVVTVMQGAASEQFVRLADDSFSAAAGGGASATVTGSRIAVRLPKFYDGIPPQGAGQVEEVSRVWDTSSLQVSTKGRHGDVRSYGRWTWGLRGVGDMYGFRLTQWQHPEGVALTVAYGAELLQPTQVTSNLGLTLPLPALPNQACVPGSVPAPVLITDAASGVHRAVFRAPFARSITQRPIAGCLLERTFTPRSATAPTVQYAYDSVGRVKEARDAIALASPSTREPHRFFVAEGYRGEREDPLGGRYAVETLNNGRLTRHIDEMGRVSTAASDGRGRVKSRTSTWGDITEFKYDDRNNITELKRLSRAGCGTDAIWCQSSTTTATYHPTWNKPTTITLPATNLDGQAAGTWTFAYDSQGRLETQISPLVFDGKNGGNGNAIWRTWYDSYGRVTRTQDPTGIEATMVYGGGGQPLYCLTSQVGSAQSGGFQQTSSFTCNAAGDVLTATDPRGNVTTTTYDAMRRKLTETGPAGTEIQTQWTYDADGNPTHEHRWDSTAAAWRTTLTSYSLTGKPLTVTDPSGDVARTCYDGLDRATVAVDPSGRATRTTYNLAGQPTQVERWFTASVADAGCTLTNTRPEHLTTNRWRGMEYNAGGLLSAEIDGNGNRTTMTYDGLGRHMVTTYADGKYDQKILNERDQAWLTIRRSTERVQAFYDSLGRPYWTLEHPSGGGWPGGRHARTSFDLASRPVLTAVSTQAGTFDYALERDVRTYTYDAAGRVQYDRIKPTDGSMGSAQLVLTYGYDQANNRTSIQWPDGSTATYRFDAANRTDRVTFGGHQADIALDSLSRRTGLTRSNGVNTTYAYETDSDLSQINHAWAPSAGQTAAIYGFQHDAAGRITSLGINRPDLEWAPSPSYAQTYGVPTNLNQTTSRNGVALTWNDAGNLTSYGSTTYEWGFGSRLTRVLRPGSTMEYAYDSQDRRTVVIEDGVMTRTLWSGSDEVGEYDAAGGLKRRFIPDGSGSMDARLATVDANGTVHWHHTDHQGSVVATSNAAGQGTGFTNYSPHGEFGTGAGNVPLTAPPTGSPFGYTGRQWDAKAGLYQYRARYYSPELGIFLSMDPIGTKDDPNLYGYVGLDPVNKTDPTGATMEEIWRTSDGNVRVEAYPGPPAGGREHARHGPGQAYHVHLFDARGRNEVRLSTESWQPLTREDAERMTRQQRSFVANMTAEERSYISRANRDMFHQGSLSGNTNARGYAAVMSRTTARADREAAARPRSIPPILRGLIITPRGGSGQ